MAESRLYKIAHLNRGTIQLLGELYLLAFGDIMLTSKEYLQQAAECLQLANVSSDVYVKEALTELASDFKAMAKEVGRPCHLISK
jgi:hypothetical protein